MKYVQQYDVSYPVLISTFFFSGSFGGDCRHEDRPGGGLWAGDDDHQGARQQRREMHQDGQLLQVRKKNQLAGAGRRGGRDTAVECVGAPLYC